MTKLVALALAAAIFLAAGTAWADTCETFPGSQVYTDQGCDKPYDNSAKQNAPAPQQAPGTGLRDILRKALSGGTAGANGGAATSNANAGQFDQRIQDARARADAALADPNAPGAQDRYNAAMKDLHAAYGDAEKAFPDQAGTIRNSESQDAAAASQRAANAGWNAPAAADAEPAKPAGPDNVTAVGSDVYVCDGAIAGANNVSCRQISASGQCTSVTLADGGVGWQDSTTTPCSDSDLSQRSAFLAGNGDAANAVQQAPPGFAMSPAETDAEIKRLTAGMPPDRPIDADEAKDWSDAMADDPDQPPSIEDADAKTPLDPSTFASNDDDDDNNGNNLDDAIDMLNAASSILGAASALSHTPSVSAPTVRIPRPVLRAPTVQTYRPTTNAPSTITGGN
jgi:hypothetical protein